MNTINLPWAGTASVSPTVPSTKLKSHGNFSYTVTLWHRTFAEDSMTCIIIHGISEWKVWGRYSLPLVQTPQTVSQGWLDVGMLKKSSSLSVQTGSTSRSWHENKLVIKLILCHDFPCLLLTCLTLTYHFFISPLSSPRFQIHTYIVPFWMLLPFLFYKNHEGNTRNFGLVPLILYSLDLLLHNYLKDLEFWLG